jgi:hypothetical protein
VKVCEEDLPFAEQVVFLGHRFLHLEDHVGGVPHGLRIGNNLGPGALVSLAVER